MLVLKKGTTVVLKKSCMGRTTGIIADHINCESGLVRYGIKFKEDGAGSYIIDFSPEEFTVEGNNTLTTESGDT